MSAPSTDPKAGPTPPSWTKVVTLIAAVLCGVIAYWLARTAVRYLLSGH